AIRADFNAIGRPHAGGDLIHFAIHINTPNLASRFLPIRIARPQGAIGGDREIIRLVLGWNTRKYFDPPAMEIEPQDIVAGVIRYESDALAIKPNAIAQRPFGHFDEHLCMPARS